MRKFTDEQMFLIIREAILAGQLAGKTSTPTPMNVIGRNAEGGEQTWHVPDGPCGFASVHLKPATSRFAKFLKRECGWRKHTYGGIYYPIFDFDQSHDRKAAAAEAIALHLQSYGIPATWTSRLD